MSASSDQDTIPDTFAPCHDDLISRFFGPVAAPVRVEIGALSHTGKFRPNNEDHYSVVRRRRSREMILTNMPVDAIPRYQDDEVYAMAVADGIGGAAFGEFASLLALKTGWDLTTHAVKWHFQVNDNEADELKELLKVYGQLIHQRLRQEASGHPQMTGMGTTITAAITIGFDAFIANAGDSRAYLFRDGTLKQLTRDHTLAQHLVDTGAIPTVSAASRRMRSMLINCLGGSGSGVEVDVDQVALHDGDRLLLCTDGLSDMVGDRDIEQVLARHTSPEQAAPELVQLALDNGGRDNVTVIVARFTSIVPPPVGERTESGTA